MYNASEFVSIDEHVPSYIEDLSCEDCGAELVTDIEIEDGICDLCHELEQLDE